MRLLATSLTVLLLLSACAQVVLVEAKRHDVLGTYQVTPTSAWNRMESGRTVVWTKDGFGLQELVFIKPIGDGEILFDAPEERKPPKFRAGMQATDIQDYILSSLSSLGVQAVEGGNLRPFKLSGNRGFRFDLSYTGQRGNLLVGEAFGAVVEGKLHVILYVGHPVHYFDLYKQEAQLMVKTLTL